VAEERCDTYSRALLGIVVFFFFHRVDKEDEMSCLIKGCNFLLKNISDEAFVYQRHGSPEYKFQNADPNIFPYLLVNIGSGVSIMKVIFARFMLNFCTF
jgi:pantothenate kinase